MTRLFFISTILLFSISETLFGQTVQRKFKTFTDSSFKSGDIILSHRILFKLSDCSLIPETKDSIKYIADFISKHPTFKIEVGVHTDSRGKKDANLKLSECRAKSITDCLTKDFLISPDKILSKGYGSSQLLLSDDEIKKIKCKDCEDNTPKNRRVEIKILETN